MVEKLEGNRLKLISSQRKDERSIKQITNQQKNEFKKGDTRLSLGEVQQELFQQFYHNQGSVVDKDILLDCLESPSSTTLRVAINKLRQTTGLPIENVRGVGYVLETC